MLDIRSLKNFIVLARLRSFSKAAEHCNITTSGLSRRISAIESWLGTLIFDRSRHQLELTEAGKELHEIAINIVESLERTKKSIQARIVKQQNTIRIAAPHIMSRVFFPDWLPHLHRKFSNMHLSIISANVPECFQALEASKVDFVLTFSDATNGIQHHIERLNLPWNYPSITLGVEPLIAVSSPNLRYEAQHKLVSNGPPISFLPYSEECSLNWALESALLCLPGLPQLERSHESSLADGVRSMALSGLGVAWLPLTCIRQDLELKRLVRAANNESDIPLDIRLVCRPGKMETYAEELWKYLL